MASTMRRPLGDRRRRQQRRGAVAVGDDRDRVVGAQAVARAGPVTTCTRPRRSRMSIEPDVSMTKVMFAGGRSSSAISRDVMPMRTSAVPSARSVSVAGVDGDGEVGVGGRSVAVVEGVDPLLGPDRVGLGPVALGEERLGDVERAGVDVEGERRLAVVGGGDPRRVARRRRTCCRRATPGSSMTGISAATPPSPRRRRPASALRRRSPPVRASIAITCASW